MEKNMLENDDDLMNNNNNNSNNQNDGNNNSKNNQNDEKKQTDSDDGETAKDKISIKSNDKSPNSQDNLQSITNVAKKSSSTSPSTSVKQNNWISPNPFVNYIRHCPKTEFFQQPDRQNFLQFASTRWRLMSSKEKQPYVNGAALIKKQRLMKIETAKRGQKRKRLSGIMTMKKSDPSGKKGKKDKNKDKNKDKKDKKKKSKRSEKRKKMKRQRLMKNDTESDSGTDNSPETSDNESVASDEIM